MAANNGARNTHGMSRDRLYWRWMGIHAKCYRVDNASYTRYGAKGITVDWDWHRDNNLGLQNFVTWLESKLKELGNPDKYAVVLDDQSKSFGPTNCLVRTHQFAIQRRAFNAFSPDRVIEMRRYKRTHPETTLEQMAEKFGGSASSVSRVLTGVDYANVDAIEPPINVEQLRKEIKAKQRLRREVEKLIRLAEKYKDSPNPNVSPFSLGTSIKLASFGE